MALKIGPNVVSIPVASDPIASAPVASAPVVSVLAASAQIVSASNGGGRNHTKAKSLDNIDLEKPGWLRVGHLMTLFSVSHSTLYKHIKHGQVPEPDGRTGKRPYWRTETIRVALSN